MKNIIHQIFKKKEVIEHPPILVDVGASGTIHKKWQEFASYCICIAFDADDREFHISEKESVNYKKLYKFNCIVSDREDEKLDFYLTENPFCSSILKPNHEVVKNYIYEQNFNIHKKVNINNISLSKALEKLGIDKIDWLKTDSQGIDLRIYQGLTKDVQDNALVVEFEPGLCASYEGEDTVFHIMSYMDQKGFWLSGFDVKGVSRGSKEIFDSLFQNSIYQNFAKATLKKAPKWVEMTYINSFNGNKYSMRAYLLGCLFSMINKEYLNTLKLADKGFELFQDEIFKSIRSATLIEIKKSFLNKNIVIDFGRKMKKALMG